MNHTLEKAITDHEDDCRDFIERDLKDIIREDEECRNPTKQTPVLTEWLFRAKISMDDINQKEALGL